MFLIKKRLKKRHALYFSKIKLSSLGENLSIIKLGKKRMKMEQSNLILTIDFGTQSVRVSIFDRNGNTLACEKQTYEPAYFSSKPGYAEQDPAYYYDCLCKCSQRICKNEELMKRVKGITMTCFRDSAVLLDKDNKVIRPMILWLDQRYAKCEKPLPLFSRLAFGLVGMSPVIQMNRRRTVANWVKENEPENFARINKYVALSTYFNYKLTGNLIDSASDYTGHYPLNYKEKQWYKKPETHMQGQIFSIKKNQLCELVECEQEIGKISKKASFETGLPEGLFIYACGSDKSCETLGTGVIKDTILSISLGTACSVETSVNKFMSPSKFFPAYPSALPGQFNLDVQVYRGYWMINWFLKEFGAMNINDLVIDDVYPEDYNKNLFSIPAGSNGLLLQPFWGSNLDKPEVKGSIIGFSDSTTRLHVYKAIIEGIDYELRLASEGFAKNLRHGFNEIRIAGGGSRSDEICQITADIFNLPVTRVQTNETSSLGAAIIGFLATKEFEDVNEAISSMVHPSITFKPNKENAKIYEELYQNCYKGLYPKLKGTYKYLFDFSARNR